MSDFLPSMIIKWRDNKNPYMPWSLILKVISLLPPSLKDRGGLGMLLRVRAPPSMREALGSWSFVLAWTPKIQMLAPLQLPCCPVTCFAWTHGAVPLLSFPPSLLHSLLSGESSVLLYSGQVYHLCFPALKNSFWPETFPSLLHVFHHCVTYISLLKTKR